MIIPLLPLSSMRLQRSARPDLGLENKRSKILNFFLPKIFFKSNPLDIEPLRYNNFYFLCVFLVFEIGTCSKRSIFPKNVHTISLYYHSGRVQYYRNCLLLTCHKQLNKITSFYKKNCACVVKIKP